jgi:hypothetical protein
MKKASVFTLAAYEPRVVPLTVRPNDAANETADD